MTPRVGCVILAAGQSVRFGAGETKLLLPFAHRPLVQHTIDAVIASNASGCTLVLGAHSEKILRAVDPRRCSVVINDDWRSGITSSIRAGLSQHLNDDACIFVVGDQPFISTTDLDRLIERYSEHRASIVALRVGSIWGTPVLFPNSDYSTLQKLRGDSGAKQYAERCLKRVVFVDSARTDSFADIDTPEDYERLAP